MTAETIIIVDGIEYVPKKSLSTRHGKPYQIVRCHNAGVHAGYVTKQIDGDLHLEDSRRLWRWHGRTLSGLAIEGTTDESKCKYGPVVPSMTINSVDWCERLDCTDAGRESIENMKDWKNE